ncbi:hypothetical protein HPL003_13705 [Paenibacillus terrae HPL-003]|uniref:Uncharacterized protein n=1 Tax=Paenibacillus terrae (strain HPL-003) TaxID=985665 RepID=G7VYV2_PAETH|nr:hypothetical protein HPL003_13705 [Paenibacillus terrae HPL-003]
MVLAQEEETNVPGAEGLGIEAVAVDPRVVKEILIQEPERLQGLILEIGTQHEETEADDKAPQALQSPIPGLILTEEFQVQEIIREILVIVALPSRVVFLALQATC